MEEPGRVMEKEMEMNKVGAWGAGRNWPPETGGPHPPTLGLCTPQCVQRPRGEMQRDGNREQHMGQSGYRVVTRGNESWMKPERQAPATQGPEGPSWVLCISGMEMVTEGR